LGDKEKKIGGNLMTDENNIKEINIDTDLNILEGEIKIMSDSLRKLDEERLQLLAKLQQVQGAAAYLRGKQNPDTNETEEEKSEEKSEEEITNI
jgi:ribosomal protein L12E/L44/L45/RPP1/RPP2